MGASGKEELLPWFIKKANPVFKFFNNIDNSYIIGLIFAGIVFFFIVGCWYWVFFKNGAQSWKDGIIRYYKKLGINVEPISFLFSPLLLKVFITLALVVSLVFFFFATMV